MTADSKQHYDIVEHNIVVFVKELEKKLLDGWAISPTNPGDVVGLYGGTFTVSLYRDESTVQRLRNRAEGTGEKPKLDRGAILANARAAKAEKRQQGKKK